MTEKRWCRIHRVLQAFHLNFTLLTIDVIHVHNIVLQNNFIVILFRQALAAITFIVNSVCYFLQILHMCPAETKRTKSNDMKHWREGIMKQIEMFYLEQILSKYNSRRQFIIVIVIVIICPLHTAWCCKECEKNNLCGLKITLNFITLTWLTCLLTARIHNGSCFQLKKNELLRYTLIFDMVDVIYHKYVTQQIYNEEAAFIVSAKLD